MTTAYGALYLNSAFGFPALTAIDLPSGGPAYPLAAPFVRAQVKASDKLALVAAVYADDPAPPGPGDPQVLDRNGTAFRLDGHALAFGELRYSPDPAATAALPTTYKLGLWYATGPFADPRLDRAGGLLADPANSGLPPREHDGDYAIYGVVDQAVWRQPGTKDQGIGVFVRLMAGSGDRNLSSLMVDGGVNWHGPFAARPDDITGLALCYLGISPAAQGYGRDLVAFGRAAGPFSGDETAVEATYQAPLTDWLKLQPDAQLVLNPNAGMPDAAGRAPHSPALVIGLRVTIRL
jgi:porin